MSTKDLIIQELEETSEPLLTQVLNFVRFLKFKHIQEIRENQEDLDDSYESLKEAQEKGTISLEAFKEELGL